MDPQPSTTLAERPSLRSCPAFLLAGEDDLAKAARIEALVTEHLGGTDPSFGLDRLSARDVDPSSLATLLQTAPMLAEHRVVVLTEGESASAAVEQVLADYLERPVSTTCLIAVVAGRPAAEPWKTWRRVGREEVFELPRGPAAVRARIRRELERAGREISNEAAALLAELNPEGSTALTAELAKVQAHAGDRRRIELEDVEAVAVSSVGANKYTFVDLVGMGRREEALAELHALLEEGESPIYLVTLLAQHFLLLGGIRACEAGGVRGAAAVARALGKPAWLLDRRNPRIPGHQSPRVQARRHDRAAIDRWLTGLLELDLALKSSRLPSAALMEEAVLRLMSHPPS